MEGEADDMVEMDLTIEEKELPEGCADEEVATSSREAPKTIVRVTYQSGKTTAFAEVTGTDGKKMTIEVPKTPEPKRDEQGADTEETINETAETHQGAMQQVTRVAEESPNSKRAAKQLRKERKKVTEASKEMRKKIDMRTKLRERLAERRAALGRMTVPTEPPEETKMILSADWKER